MKEFRVKTSLVDFIQNEAHQRLRHPSSHDQQQKKNSLAYSSLPSSCRRVVYEWTHADSEGETLRWTDTVKVTPPSSNSALSSSSSSSSSTADRALSLSGLDLLLEALTRTPGLSLRNDSVPREPSVAGAEIDCQEDAETGPSTMITTELSLRGNRIGAEGYVQLLQRIQSIVRTVQDVDEQRSATAPTPEWVALQRLLQFHALNLGRTLMDNEGLTAFVALISFVSKLQSDGLPPPRLPQCGVHSHPWRNLTELSFAYNNIGVRGVQSFAEVVGEHLPQLTVLNFSFNRLMRLGLEMLFFGPSGEESRSLAPPPPPPPQARASPFFAQSAVTHTPAQQPSPSSRRNAGIVALSQLRVLQLADNTLNDDAIAAVFQSATPQQLDLVRRLLGQLHELDLSRNRITGSGATVIAKHCLPYCAQLRSFVIAENPIRLHGAVAMGGALFRMQHVPRVLDMKHCQVTFRENDYDYAAPVALVSMSLYPQRLT